MLNVGHKQLPFYQSSLELVTECSSVLEQVPGDERYGLVRQIKRAAVSIPLNIAEGSSRSSPFDRKRFFEIARSSAVELDTGFELLVKLNMIEPEQLGEMSAQLNHCFRQLSNVITKLRTG